MTVIRSTQKGDLFVSACQNGNFDAVDAAIQQDYTRMMEVSQLITSEALKIKAQRTALEKGEIDPDYMTGAVGALSSSSSEFEKTARKRESARMDSDYAARIAENQALSLNNTIFNPGGKQRITTPQRRVPALKPWVASSQPITDLGSPKTENLKERGQRLIAEIFNGEKKPINLLEALKEEFPTKQKPDPWRYFYWKLSKGFHLPRLPSRNYRWNYRRTFFLQVFLDTKYKST